MYFARDQQESTGGAANRLRSIVVLAARPFDLRFGAIGANTLRGLQHELDLHSPERKHYAALLRAIKNAGTK
jgi:hypothetical protein